jgi:hypothetical protein
VTDLVAHHEHLGPLDGVPIAVCPVCGAKAWSLCHACGWEQWTPTDDPDRLRDEEGTHDYGRLLDGHRIHDWRGILASPEATHEDTA